MKIYLKCIDNKGVENLGLELNKIYTLKEICNKNNGLVINEIILNPPLHCFKASRFISIEGLMKPCPK